MSSTTHKTPNAQYAFTLDWHGMACPNCLSTSNLEVAFRGRAQLTPDGSVDMGVHEWGDDSPCKCTQCDFASMAFVFRMGEDGDTVRIPVYAENAEPVDQEDLPYLDLALSFTIEETSDQDGTQVTLTRDINGWRRQVAKGIARDEKSAAKLISSYQGCCKGFPLIVVKR